MKLLLLLLAIAILTTPWMAEAQTKPGPVADPQNPQSWERGVERCRAHVRSTVDSGFDAFVNRPWQVRDFGSPRGSFEFDKCMTQIGFNIRDVDPADKASR